MVYEIIIHQIHSLPFLVAIEPFLQSLKALILTFFFLRAFSLGLVYLHTTFLSSFQSCQILCSFSPFSSWALARELPFSTYLHQQTKIFLIRILCLALTPPEQFFLHLLGYLSLRFWIQMFSSKFVCLPSP